jgi:uncharacterized protein YukE
MPEYNFTQVDSGLVGSAATVIGGQIDELRTIAKTVGNDFITAMNPYWQGPAKQNFDNKIVFFNYTLLNVIAEYAQLNDELIKASDLYGKADEAALSSIAKLPK